MTAPDRAVIFDMDGVILLSAEAHFQSWQVVAERYGWEVTHERFLASFGQINAEVVPLLFQRSFEPAEIERIGYEKEAAFVEILAGDLPIAPGTRELLEALRSEGVATAVGTSAPPENLDLVLDGADLRGLFDATIHGKDVTRGKPDPQVFLMAAERLGVAPDRCVVIEDAPVGVEAAKAAGMRAVAVLTTNAEDLLARAGSDWIAPDLVSLGTDPERFFGTPA